MKETRQKWTRIRVVDHSWEEKYVSWGDKIVSFTSIHIYACVCVNFNLIVEVG